MPPFSPFAVLRPLCVVLLLALAGCSVGDEASQEATPAALTTEPAPTPSGADPSTDDATTAPSPAEAPQASEAVPSESSEGEAGDAEEPALPSAVPTVPARGTPTELEPSEPFGLSTVILRGPGGRVVEVPVYVASTREQRARGLMDRDSLPADTGMVFLFPSESRGAFYMYRTRIPLSIAFFAADGRVVSVLDMEPCPESEPGRCPLYPPNATYTAALEVNQGYLAELGVDVGWTLDLPEDLPAAS